MNTTGKTIALVLVFLALAISPVGAYHLEDDFKDDLIDNRNNDRDTIPRSTATTEDRNTFDFRETFDNGSERETGRATLSSSMFGPRYDAIWTVRSGDEVQLNVDGTQVQIENLLSGNGRVESVMVNGQTFRTLQEGETIMVDQDIAMMVARADELDATLLFQRLSAGEMPFGNMEEGEMETEESDIFDRSAFRTRDRTGTGDQVIDTRRVSILDNSYGQDLRRYDSDGDRFVTISIVVADDDEDNTASRTTTRTASRTTTRETNRNTGTASDGTGTSVNTTSSIRSGNSGTSRTTGTGGSIY